MHLFGVFVVLCVGSGLATGCREVDRWMDGWMDGLSSYYINL
jgi:hypothetical protein